MRLSWRACELLTRRELGGECQRKLSCQMLSKEFPVSTLSRNGDRAAFCKGGGTAASTHEKQDCLSVRVIVYLANSQRPLQIE